MNLKLARRKLSDRITFRGLKISVETDKGELRHWYDPHNKEHGTTKMRYPYGYIRRTEGIDGDHVDCYVGPNEYAENVYIVHQNKAPDFTEYDEDKCMLGFNSMDAAKKAYLAHYNNERFLGGITKMNWADFEKKVKRTFDRPTKLATAHIPNGGLTMRQHVKHAQLLGMLDAVEAFYKIGVVIGRARQAIKHTRLARDIVEMMRIGKPTLAKQLLEQGMSAGVLSERAVLENPALRRIYRPAPAYNQTAVLRDYNREMDSFLNPPKPPPPRPTPAGPASAAQERAAVEEAARRAPQPPPSQPAAAGAPPQRQPKQPKQQSDQSSDPGNKDIPNLSNAQLAALYGVTGGVGLGLGGLAYKGLSD